MRKRHQRLERHETHERWAAIVDGDNVVSGGHVDLAEAAALFASVREVTRGMPTTCALQRALGMRYLSAYADRGWRIRWVPRTPDAADRELLDVAEAHLARGVTDLFVVSGDHAFAELAGRARLHVVSRRDALSHRLRVVADSVAYVDEPVAGPRPGARPGIRPAARPAPRPRTELAAAGVAA